MRSYRSVSGKGGSQDSKNLERAVQQINRNESWLGVTAATAEDAIERLQRFDIDLLVVTGDIGEAEVRKLSKVFTVQQEDALILQPVSLTDAELLCNEIAALLKEQKASKKPSLSVIDDALKGAALNIRFE